LEYFESAEKLFSEGSVDSGATLFVLAAIKFNDFMCQKYLQEIPRAKDHKSVLGNQVKRMSVDLGDDYAGYAQHLRFILEMKNDTEYGVAGDVSGDDAALLKKHCERLKAIVDKHFSQCAPR
jgi:hypothetical protein